MFQKIQDFDTVVLNFMNTHLHNSILDRVMPFITSLGNAGLIWIIISILLLLCKKHRKTGMMVLAALIIATALGEGVIKHLVQRPRPCADIPAYKLLIAKPLSYSFPSGHTTASFAAAGILIRAFKQYWIYILTLASLIAFSRMYLDVHYPTDIIGGIVLGLFCSWIVWTLSKRCRMFGE